MTKVDHEVEGLGREFQSVGLRQLMLSGALLVGQQNQRGMISVLVYYCNMYRDTVQNLVARQIILFERLIKLYINIIGSAKRKNSTMPNIVTQCYNVAVTEKSRYQKSPMTTMKLVGEIGTKSKFMGGPFSDLISGGICFQGFVPST